MNKRKKRSQLKPDPLADGRWVRFTKSQDAAVRKYARKRGMNFSTAVRVLVVDGLRGVGE